MAADYGHAKPHEGKQLLQIWAELDARALREELNPFGAFVYTPEIVDAEGFTQEAEIDTDCNPADDGHQFWGTEVQEGDKEKVYGSFWVPTGIKELRINDIIFKVKGQGDVGTGRRGSEGAIYPHSLIFRYMSASCGVSSLSNI